MISKCLILLITAIFCNSTWGFPELAYLNTSIDPCDDFYQFSCGNFANIHPKPSGELYWDPFAILQKEINDLLKDILSSGRSEDEPEAVQKVKAFYQSCLDLDYAAQLNSPQAEVLKKYQWPAISDRYNETEDRKLSWTDVGHWSHLMGIPLFFDLTVMPSFSNASLNGILLLTDDSNDANNGIRGIRPIWDKIHVHELQDSYLQFLKSTAYYLRNETNSYKSDAEIDHELQETLQFMQQLLRNGIPPNEALDPLRPEMPLFTLQEWTNKYFPEQNISWIDYFKKVFNAESVSESTPIMQTSTNQTFGVLNLYRNASARILRNFLFARYITLTADEGDPKVRHFWHKHLQESGILTTREQYCFEKIYNDPKFSAALVHVYQKYHFNNQKLQAIKELHDGIMETFNETIKSVSWMDEASREAALVKLKSLITLLAYPEELINGDYIDSQPLNEQLGICTWDSSGNLFRLRQIVRSLSLQEALKPKQRDLWDLSPLVVNAFYKPTYNRMVLPVSILNPLFFNGKETLLDLARLGAIIGHEFTHGFDSTGSNYNEEGLPGTWWSQETIKQFDELTKCFENQYSQYYIDKIGQNVNGVQTKNENIADNGGLRTAYKTFKKMTLSAPKGPYTAEQMFFIGFATMYCSEETKEYLQQLHDHKGYPPSKFRVIGTVSNMPEFAQAFNCPANSPMNPSNKCVLW